MTPRKQSKKPDTPKPPGPEPKRLKIEGDLGSAMSRILGAGKPEQKGGKPKGRKKKAR